MLVAINQSQGRGKAASLKDSYINYLWSFGLEPLVLHPSESEGSLLGKLRRSAGLLLIGGPDVPAEFYGGRCHQTIRPQEVGKVQTDFLALHCAVALNKPVLGICAGMQTLAVYFGGTLMPHIPEAGSVIEHQSTIARHPVNLSPGGERLFRSQRFEVNSRHHQCVEYPGPELSVMAEADDGIIEAVAHRNLPVVGVQWHPEDLMPSFSSRRLMYSFVRGYRQSVVGAIA